MDLLQHPPELPDYLDYIKIEQCRVWMGRLVSQGQHRWIKR